MPRRCLNTVQRRKVQPATVPDASRVAGAGKVRLDELLTETITGEWGGESSPSKGVAVLRTTNFTNCGEINYDNLAWREIAKDKVERKHLCVGDIVVEKSGGTKDHPVGRVVFFDRADGLYLCNNFTQILRPDRNLIVPRFLFYTLRAKYEMRVTESMYNKTTGIQNLKMSLYMAMPVTLPPLPTQQRIADELDQLCALKKNAEDRLAILDQIVKSRFVEMFGDPITNDKEFSVVKLKDVAQLITKGASPKWQGFSYTEDSSQTLFVTSENVREGFLDLSEKKYLEDGFNDKQRRSMLKDGDFLINIVGASIGRAALYNLDVKANINQAVALVRMKDGVVTHEYMLCYLNSPKALLMYDGMKSSVARANLSLADIAGMELLLPPLSLQDEFAAFVAEVDKSKLTLRETVATLDQLYRAKLQEYFG